MEDSGPTADRPDVDCEMCHPTLAVTSVRAAIDFYTTKLGFWVAFTEGDPPAFAGVNLGRVQVFLEHGTPAPEGCSVYFVVSDADTLHQFHRSRGVEILESPADKPYKLRDYTVQDPYGYRLTFGHRLR
jgi:catechol 2,3-dioxygenase-like lactoylglutathione lyase family enzyme